MRSAILWGSVAIHTIIATGRHIPFEAFANVPRLDYDVRVFPAIGADGPVSPTTRKPGDRPGDDEDTVISRAINPLPASANDELWTKYARKGNSLTCAMCGTDLGAGYQQDDKRVPPSAVSIWNGNIWDNPTWYWWDSQFEKRWCDIEGFWPMANTLKPMGMSTKSSTNGGDIHCFCVRHNNEAIRPDPELPFIPMPVSAQFYKAEEKFYRATDAFYFFAMDTRAGVIFGINLKSAAEMARRRWGREPREDELPKLRKLSDLYWSYWAWQHLLDGSDITHLNAYIVHSVQNTRTAAIAARAVRGRGRDRYEPYPGQLFYVESAEGEALLGSPIGATIGYFLMQHKKQLGDKYVYAIRIVVSGNPSPLDSQDPDVIFYIMDVPPTKAIPDASNQDPPQGCPQSEAPAIPPSNHLALRGLPSPHVTEQILGPKNIVRVHTIMAY